MIATLAETTPAALAGFDAIIDVRSPAEFAEDHVPGAINLPVLDDEERARVGTIYVQESRFLARRIGAALVARNIARHLEGALSERTGAFAPLIYCWRGGQRSGAMATILDQVGWRVSVLAGGYRTYRRRVTAALYDADPSLRLVLLDGPTGVAKTDILARLAARGTQMIDLEGLAAHRGSLFGALPEAPQPPQKLFESRLLAVLERLDPSRPVVVEAESSKVGDINLPPGLWKAMTTARRIVLGAPAPDRARYLLEAYGDIVRDRARLEDVIERLPPHHGREQKAIWRTLAAAGDDIALATSLIEAHYDPGYARSARRDGRALLGEIRLPDLSAASREAAADEIVALLQTEPPCPTTPDSPLPA
jgi:tRNA 2-selenouridine synthase